MLFNDLRLAVYIEKHVVGAKMSDPTVPDSSRICRFQPHTACTEIEHTAKRNLKKARRSLGTESGKIQAEVS